MRPACWQSGIARGYVTEEVLAATHERLHELLRLKGAKVDALYYAPHHATAQDARWRDDPEELRKPGVGMINKARQDFPIDMARSVMIGDRINDVICAHKAGLPGVLVKSGYGLGEWTYERERWTDQPDFICNTLGQAVNWFLRKIGREKPVANSE
jgi:D-glycero-D-manno-heptose 1,7-bisphosphate phosphatase